MDERIERSRLLYERALFEGDTGALEAAEFELDGVEADLALGRGRVIHGRFLQQRAEDPEQASGAHGLMRQIEEARAQL